MSGADKKHGAPPVEIDLDEEPAEEYERMSFVDLVTEQAPARTGHGRQPAEVTALLSRWLLAFSTGDYDDAIAAARQAVTILPDDLSVHCKLATGFLMAGRYDEAASTLEFILDRDSGHEEAKSLADSREILGWLMKQARERLKARDFDNALAPIERAIRFVPEYPESWVMRAIIWYQKGLKPECLADLRKVLQINPEHQQARKLLDELSSR